MQSAAGEGMTRGQYLPGGAAQQEEKGQPSALVTAPVTSAAQAACATAPRTPRQRGLPFQAGLLRETKGIETHGH